MLVKALSVSEQRSGAGWEPPKGTGRVGGGSHWHPELSENGSARAGGEWTLPGAALGSRWEGERGMGQGEAPRLAEANVSRLARPGSRVYA